MLSEDKHHGELALQHEELGHSAEVHRLQAASLARQVRPSPHSQAKQPLQQVLHPRRVSLRVEPHQAGKCFRADQSQQVRRFNAGDDHAGSNSPCPGSSRSWE